LSTVAIPHDIEPHPMTGMYNGKFGLWLFLASEVMLFGALFSTYVLLRVGAPAGTWPAHGSEILDIPKATFNTLVLIGSSVTMVLAWASLKMNDVAKGRLFLLITFLLAGTFLVVKYFEYRDKFHHHEVFVKEPVLVGGKEYMNVSGHLTEDSPALTRAPRRWAFSIPEYVLIVADGKYAAEGHGESGAEAGADHGHPEPIRIEGSNIHRLTDYGPWHSTFLATYFTLTGLHGLHIVGGMVVIFYLLVASPSMWNGRREKLINRVECTGLYWHFVDLVWIFLFPVFYLL